MDNKRKFKLRVMPCPPMELDGVEEWVNGVQDEVWRVKFFGVLLPFLAVLVPAEKREEYAIILDVPGLEYKGRKLCALREIGFIVRDKRRFRYSEKEYRWARMRFGGGSILMLVFFGLLMRKYLFEFASVIEAVRNTFYFFGMLVTVPCGAWLMINSRSEERPLKHSWPVYLAIVFVIRVWFILMIIEMIIEIVTLI